MSFSLNGQWEYLPDTTGDLSVHNLPQDGWQTMVIPVNWQLAGLDNYSGVVWFRRRFPFTPHRDKRVWLRFMGVDYFADVWLNDARLGGHEGYFQPFEFDVTGLVRDDNELVVRVDSPLEPPGEVWPDRKRLIKGVLNHHDCRPGAWDPNRGQEKNTGGIWNDVLLYETADIRVTGVRIAPVLLADASAVLRTALTIDNYREEKAEITIRLAIEPDNFRGEPIVEEWEELIGPGRTTITRMIHIDQPQLWWTWDYGPQNLYAAVVTISQAGAELDVHSERFGIRQLIVDKQNGWRLNGKPFFPRGTNVIPAQWLSEYDPQKIARDLALIRDANINAVRVHAHVTRSEFYDACDEAGILVWQDFPLQWSYREDDEFYHAAVKQLREMIDLLYNHASVLVWCCHNEPSVNTNMLDNILDQVAREADSSRYVEHHSDYRDHPYPGWYYGHLSLFLTSPGAPFANEFGAQALPNLDSMRRMMPADKLWPPDWDEWAYHDFQYDQTFGVAGLELPDTLAEFVKISQEYQYRLLKFGIETYRREGRMTGIFQFMFMDPWPAITWSVVDYWRVPKLGYKALQIGFQPVLVSLVVGRNRLLKDGRNAFFLYNVVIVNDLNSEFTGAELHLWLEDKQGKIWREERQRVDIPAHDRVTVTTPMLREGKWKPIGLPVGHYTLHGEVTHAGAVISRNEERFTVFDKAPSTD